MVFQSQLLHAALGVCPARLDFEHSPPYTNFFFMRKGQLCFKIANSLQ
jgi:hypothetical protein